MGRTPRENRCGILSRPGGRRPARPFAGEASRRAARGRAGRRWPPDSAGPWKNTAACLAACLLSLPGCSRQATPEDAWRRYLSALSEGRIETAFDGLSEESRARLARLEEAEGGDGTESAGAPGSRARSEKPGLAYFRRRIAAGGGGGVAALPEEPWRSVERVERHPGGARITSRTPLGPRTVELALEGGDYRIVLKLP